jgi:DME family drug/metabolite transporter
MMSPRPTTALPSRLGVLAAAALFSTGGAAIKACGLTGWQVASFRSGIAALLLLALVPDARRGWNRITLAVAAAYASTVLLFVLANKLTIAANVIYLQSTAPLYLILLSPWLLGERVRRADLPLMGALLFGLILLLGQNYDSTAIAANPALGNALATASGVSWSLTIVGLRLKSRGQDSRSDVGLAPVALGNLLAFVIGLPWALPVRAARPVDWAVLGYLGLVQIGVAYIFLTRSLRRVRAIEASALLLLEPLLNPLWAWLMQGERPGPWTVLGGGIILLSTFIHQAHGSMKR